MSCLLLLFFCFSLLAQEEKLESEEDSAFKKKLAEKRKKKEEEERKKEIINAALFAEFRQGMRNTDVQIRLLSLTSLMKMKNPAKDFMITKALEDVSPKIRMKVLEYFIKEKTTAHLNALSHVLEDHDVGVRKKIVETVLAYSDGKTNTFTLIENLLDDKQSAVRMALVEGVKKFPKSMFKNKHLFDALRNSYFDTDQAIRANAYSFISEFPLEFSYSYLESAINDSQIKTRKQILEIVAKIPDKKTLKLMTTALTDPYPPIRSRCVELLSENMNKDIINVLDNRLLSEKNYKLRRQMMEALAKKPNARVVTIISRGLKDPVLEVRRRAASLLEEIQVRVNRKK